MRIRFENHVYEVNPNETVLACLERHGVEVDSFCRGGTCQTCALRATDGAVPAEAQAGLKPAWQEQGLFLSCICRPTQELTIERADVAQAHASRILRVDRLSGNVARIWLSRPAGFDYQGGQFVQVVRPEVGVLRPYSLASSPESDELELHVAVRPNGELSPWLANGAGEPVEIRGPLGDCVHVRGDSRRPMLLAGTTTGLAPLLGVIRTALSVGHTGPIRLFHGSRSVDGLYLTGELETLRASAPNLEVAYGVLDPSGPDTLLAGAPLSREPLQDQVLRCSSDLHERISYLCGAPDFVAGLRRQLLAAGALGANVLSDAFVAPGVR